jgi:hypothetical protein
MKVVLLLALTTAVLVACNKAGNKEFIVNKKWRLTDVQNIPKDTSNSMVGMGYALAVLEAENETFEVYTDKFVRRDSAGKELSTSAVEWKDNDAVMRLIVAADTMDFKISVDQTKRTFYLKEKNGITYVYTEIK